jgi:hypothetical protein
LTLLTGTGQGQPPPPPPRLDAIVDQLGRAKNLAGMSGKTVPSRGITVLISAGIQQKCEDWGRSRQLRSQSQLGFQAVVVAEALIEAACPIRTGTGEGKMAAGWTWSADWQLGRVSIVLIPLKKLDSRILDGQASSWYR